MTKTINIIKNKINGVNFIDNIYKVYDEKIDPE